EHELSRSGKRDIVKAIPVALKIDAQFAAATHLHRDWPIDFLRRGKNECAGNHSRSTRESLVFHSTLISTNGDGARPALFQKIHVRSGWRKHGVAANHRSIGVHIDFLNVRDRDNDMGHAAIDEMAAPAPIASRNLQIETLISWLAHGQPHDVPL